VSVLVFRSWKGFSLLLDSLLKRVARFPAQARRPVSCSDLLVLFLLRFGDY
jgi:hypothetical protein